MFLNKKLFLFNVFICLALLIMSCSKDDSKNKSKEENITTESVKVAKLQSKSVNKPDNSNLNQEENLFNDEIIDKGKKCSIHKYLLTPNSSVTLSFEALLKDKKMQAINPDSIEITNNKWESFDLEVSTSMTNIDTISSTYPVWTVNCTESNKGSFIKSKKGELRLKCRDKTMKYCIIKRLGTYYSPKSVGKLSEDELEKLIEYNKSCSLEQSEMDEESKILTFELDINTPDDITKIKNKDILVKFNGVGFVIEASYDSYYRKLIIRGPAFDESCL